MNDLCNMQENSIKRQPILAVLTFLLLIAGSTGAWAWGLTPNTPTGFTVPSTDADGNYTVSWNTSTHATWYELDEKIGSGGWTTIYIGSQTSVSFSTSTVQAYSYRVVACNNQDCSDESSIKTVNVTGGIVPPTSEGSTGAAGNTPYSIDVASDGDTMINVPIRLIPGVAGFAPSLSLSYDSGRGIDLLEQSMPEDTLGYGWRLSGLSQIRRCVVGEALSTSIQLTSADKLCLNGMPMVLASGSPWSPGAIYRSQIENFVKIEVKGYTGSLWFEATLPNGTVQEYGKAAGSRVDKSGGVDFQWSLGKETSVDGNVIDYSYWHDPSNGINRIAEIEYDDAKVYFEYLARSDTSPISIGADSQTQKAFLHKILVEFEGKDIREYRLLDEIVDSRRRLNKVQLCGYNEAGTAETCLDALDFDWQTPSSSIVGAPILVDGMTDGLSAVHQIEYGTIIEGGSHAFVLSGSDTPFGSGSKPSDTQLLTENANSDPNDPVRHVATKLRRDNGLGGMNGFHDTLYAYQNVGLESTKHWGFLGFYAQRITDDESGIVTYVQRRMDYPYFGRVARVYQYEADYTTQPTLMERSEYAYANESISHGSNNSLYPYLDSSIDFNYEGTTLLRVSRTNNTISFDNSLIDEVVSKTEIAVSASGGTGSSTWGDVGTFTLGTIKHTAESTVGFDNRYTGGKWLIGFADDVRTERWGGPAVDDGIVQDATLTAQATSLRPTEIELFPNDDPRYPSDDHMTLKTEFGYDSAGRTTSVTVSGDNVLSRTTSVTGPSTFLHDRYPERIVNAKGHTTTNTVIDERFGTVRQSGDPNGRSTTTIRDPFGRVVSVTNADGVVVTTTYSDCTSGCPSPVHGVVPVLKVETATTNIGASVTISPLRNTYFDKLGRVIRSETESFAGSTFVKRDIKYDRQGRVEKTSLPYIGGSSQNTTRTFDLRNRIDAVTRPDGSSIDVEYSASGNNLVVDIEETVKSSGVDETQKKRNEYNILGQLIKTIDGYGSAVAPFTEYDYDANGNIEEVRVFKTGAGSASATTTFTHDAAGNQKTITGPNIGLVTSKYTALGELLTREDNKARLDSSISEATYTWDNLGRLEKIVNDDGTFNWNWDPTNGKGKIASRTGPGFSETYSYLSSGRPYQIVTNIDPISGGSGTDYKTLITYDDYGRLDTTRSAHVFPGGFLLKRQYNARGYLWKLKDGSTAIHTFDEIDAFGNIKKESYANGISTSRTFDAETGRLETIITGPTSDTNKYQDNSYTWRSNGTLEERLNNPTFGQSDTRKEIFEYDVLNRMEEARTYINGNNTRTQLYTFDDLGNVTEKTSSLLGDNDVENYYYGTTSSGPHAVDSFSVDQDNDQNLSTAYNLTYDDNGAITEYDIPNTSFDKHIAYNANNQPTKIVVGGDIDDVISDSTAQAVEEFTYGPDGQRSGRRSQWKDGANTYTEEVLYIGNTEIITDNSSGTALTITKVQLTPNVMFVEIDNGSSTEEFFEYAHRDHLGSIEVVTNDNGDELDTLALEPYGERKSSDWASNISPSELEDLLEVSSGHSRKARGFTSHEHLDRTGFIHMNGRVYDPLLGRFLSPDPFIQFPTFSQGWNRYSYLNNIPTSFVDPSGFNAEGPDSPDSYSDDNPYTRRILSGPEYFYYFNNPPLQPWVSDYIKTWVEDMRQLAAEWESQYGPPGPFSGEIGQIGLAVGGGGKEANEEPLPQYGLTSNEARIVYRNVFDAGYRGNADINDVLPKGQLPDQYVELAEEMLAVIAESELGIDIVGNTAFSGVRGLAQASLKTAVKQTVIKLFKEAIGNRNKREKILRDFFDGISATSRHGTARSARPVLDDLLYGG